MDDRLNQLTTFAMILLYIGLVIAGLPLLIVCYVFWEPCVPRKARNYIEHPDFLDDINGPQEIKNESEMQYTDSKLA